MKTKKTIVPKNIFIIFTLVYLIVVILFVNLSIKYFRIFKLNMNGIQSTGTVVYTEVESCRIGKSNHNCYRPIVRYSPIESTQIIEFRNYDTFLTNDNPYYTSKGAQVTVLYFKDQPEKAIIKQPDWYVEYVIYWIPFLVIFYLWLITFKKLTKN